MTSLHFQGKPFNITVIQVYVPTTDAREAEIVQFYKDLLHCLELAPKKHVIFIIEDWNAKVRKSRDIQNNRQVLSWSTK